MSSTPSKSNGALFPIIFISTITRSDVGVEISSTIFHSVSYMWGGAERGDASLHRGLLFHSVDTIRSGTTVLFIYLFIIYLLIRPLTLFHYINSYSQHSQFKYFDRSRINIYSGPFDVLIFFINSSGDGRNIRS